MGHEDGLENNDGPVDKAGPGNNFELPKPSGSCGSICLVKLVSTNPFSHHTCFSPFQMEQKQQKKTSKYRRIGRGGAGRGEGGSIIYFLLYETCYLPASWETKMMARRSTSSTLTAKMLPERRCPRCSQACECMIPKKGSIAGAQEGINSKSNLIDICNTPFNIPCSIYIYIYEVDIHIHNRSFGIRNILSITLNIQHRM